jgi:hypothetical protein
MIDLIEAGTAFQARFNLIFLLYAKGGCKNGHSHINYCADGLACGTNVKHSGKLTPIMATDDHRIFCHKYIKVGAL